MCNFFKLTQEHFKNLNWVITIEKGQNVAKFLLIKFSGSQIFTSHSWQTFRIDHYTIYYKHSTYCSASYEQYPPEPLQILWELSIAHIQEQYQPSATQTDAQSMSVHFGYVGHTEPSRTQWLKVTEGTSLCFEVVRVLCSNYLYSCKKHILLSKYLHE